MRVYSAVQQNQVILVKHKQFHNFRRAGRSSGGSTIIKLLGKINEAR